MTNIKHVPVILISIIIVQFIRSILLSDINYCLRVLILSWRPPPAVNVCSHKPHLCYQAKVWIPTGTATA